MTVLNHDRTRTVLQVVGQIRGGLDVPQCDMGLVARLDGPAIDQTGLLGQESVAPPDHRRDGRVTGQ